MSFAVVAIAAINVVGDGEAVKLDGGVMELSEGVEGGLSSFRGRLTKGCALPPTTAFARGDCGVSSK